MKLLLDTHAFLWSVLEPEKLSIAARESIEDIENELYVSAISALEIGIKYRLGKLSSASELVSQYSKSINKLGARTLPINDSSALTAGLLESKHRDPFDRVLYAQAQDSDLTIISRDTFF